MKSIKQLQRINRLHKMIHKSNTGTPVELAGRLNLSRSQLYNYIDLLKIYGADIQYDRKAHTFRYAKDFDVVMSINVEFISESDCIKINAGNILAKNYFRPMELDGTRLILPHES